MIIRQDKSYETNSLFPNIDWYEDENNYVIDETTEEGQIIMQTYIENYPFVEIEHTDGHVTNVVVLEEERLEEIERLENERIEQELLDSLKPSEKEVLMAEVELSTLNLLLELEVI